jgi:hypothetical protein
MEWDKVRLEYDPEYEMSYGMWRCPYCSREFFGGGEELHKQGCLKKVSYNEMVYKIGPEAVKRMLKGLNTLDGLNLEVAKRKLPELFRYQNSGKEKEMGYDYYLIFDKKINHAPMYSDVNDADHVFWDIDKHRDEIPEEIPENVYSINYDKRSDILIIGMKDGKSITCSYWSVSYTGYPGTGDPRKHVVINIEDLIDDIKE